MLLKKKKVCLTACLLLLTLGALIACSSGSDGSSDTDGDGEAPVDGDPDNDGDKDVETNGDAEPDSDSDGDWLDGDRDSDGDTEGADFEKPLPPFECAEIYSQDELMTFEIEVDAEEWAGLKNEWVNWKKRLQQGLDPKPYHPLKSFRYKDQVITDARIRLKGSYLNWEFSPTKMQFNIDFKRDDGYGRFMGLRKINLDAPHNDPSMVKDRLGMSIFRELGVPAVCVNHARLIVNGEYYGLFANIEHLDQEFLERTFGKEGDAEEGNLYKRMDWGYEKKTNESDPDKSDLERFLTELSMEELESFFDLDEVILDWAGEAVMPHNDGYWVGAGNHQLYFHPERGMIMIPWDMDYAFNTASAEEDLVSYTVPWGYGKPAHVTTVVSDREGYGRYIAAINSVLEVYQPAAMQARIDTYAAQIAEALAEDENKVFTTQEHLDDVTALRQHIEDRYNFALEWLDCAAVAGEVEQVEHEGKTYLFRKKACPWGSSSRYCLKAGGGLVVPKSEEEQDFLVAKAFELIEDNWWIGPNDIKEEGNWTGPYGEAFSYQAWADGQPNGGDAEDCALLHYVLEGFWNDKYCTLEYPAICELD